ncbi:hypothetical protein Rcae01_02152 [Novipirellula caenicola]|uniref:Uncharacterized protein n=1 Tax=Novipirellula caenicola TaxID=1536901 RepID=A0ABP9VNG0_9BACT
MGLWYERRPEDLNAGSLARSTTKAECRWSFGTRGDRMTWMRDLWQDPLRGWSVDGALVRDATGRPRRGIFSKIHYEGSGGAAYANRSCTTWPCTSVSRKSRPWKRYVSCS